ncbi:MAG TPA: histidine kinase [Rubrivivax sp.]|nr:histidine kinase [Rubrivivax sp.]
MSRPTAAEPPASDAAAASAWPASTRPAGLDTPAPARAQALPPAPAASVPRRIALDVCQPLLSLRVLLGVQGVLAIGVLLGAHSAPAWRLQQSAAMYVGVAGTLLWLVAVCALRGVLARWTTPARLASLMALGAAAALLAWWPLWWLGLARPPLGFRLGGVALAGAALGAACWAWLDLRARLWRPADARVRLAELQSRIRPHFLFNALNTALALVRVDPARAEGVLEDLAELFRVALADAGSSVSLGEEIDLAQRYLAIEQIRYGARLRLSWDIDAAATRARVPPLVLQPLVENAVRHGVEPSVDGAQVWVQALARRGQAVVLVSNTVADGAGAPGHGMALHNVRERLRLLHDVAGQLEVWREGALFRARIIVPL